MKTFEGLVLETAGLETASFEFLQDYGNEDLEQGYIWTTSLTTWTATEYRYIGGEADLTDGVYMDIEGEYYQYAGSFQVVELAYPCVSVIQMPG